MKKQNNNNTDNNTDNDSIIPSEPKTSEDWKDLIEEMQICMKELNKMGIKELGIDSYKKIVKEAFGDLKPFLCDQTLFIKNAVENTKALNNDEPEVIQPTFSMETEH